MNGVLALVDVESRESELKKTNELEGDDLIVCERLPVVASKQTEQGLA